MFSQENPFYICVVARPDKMDIMVQEVQDLETNSKGYIQIVRFPVSDEDVPK